jgi:hypothetical protein
MWYSVKMTNEDKMVGRFGVALDLMMRHWMASKAAGDVTIYCDSNKNDGGATIYMSFESKAHTEEFSRLFSAKPCDAPNLSSLKPLIQ